MCTIEFVSCVLGDKDFSDIVSLMRLLGDTPTYREDFDALCLSPHDHLCLARNENGRIVGTARLHVRLSRNGCVGFIDDVVVDATCRGEGVGRALVEALHVRARAHRVRRCTLTTRPARVEAMHLYRTLGYVEQMTTVYSVLFL